MLIGAERETPRLSAEDRARAMAVGPDRGGRDDTWSLQRLAAYVALRIAIERAFGVSVRGLPFLRSPAGRPSLPGVEGDFSLSHVEDAALIATAGRGSVGVDLERTRPLRIGPRRRSLTEAAAEHVARTGGETAPLPALPPDDRFLMAWVRLEAFAKARRTTLAQLLTAAGALGGAAPVSTAELDRRLHALAAGETPPGAVTTPAVPMDGAGQHAGAMERGTAIPLRADPGSELGSSDLGALELGLRDLAVPAGLFAACAWTRAVDGRTISCPVTPRHFPTSRSALQNLLG